MAFCEPVVPEIQTQSLCRAEMLSRFHVVHLISSVLGRPEPVEIFQKSEITFIVTILAPSSDGKKGCRGKGSSSEMPSKLRKERGKGTHLEEVGTGGAGVAQR